MPDNKSVKVYPLCQMFLLCQLINRSAVFTMPTNQSISQLYPVCQANQSIVSCIHHASQSTNQSTVSTMPANQSISQLYPLCQPIFDLRYSAHWIMRNNQTTDPSTRPKTLTHAVQVKGRRGDKHIYLFMFQGINIYTLGSSDFLSWQCFM
jgi:hypothetical protein